MTLQSVQATRIQHLNDCKVRNGRYILYWMQQSQRAEFNHALEFAIARGNVLGQGVLVGFGLMDDYPDANLRHYTFMLEGLQETQAALAEKGVKMVVQRGFPPEVAIVLGRDASLIVCDRGYLSHQRDWRAQVARSVDCSVIQVESDVIVPIEVVSEKAEYAARTIRPKIHRHVNDYLIPFTHGDAKVSSLNLKIKGLDLENIDTALKAFSIDRSVAPVSRFYKGGTANAKVRFTDFIENRLYRYTSNRNQPQADDISHMSPYLHFGQMSPLCLALQMKEMDGRFNAARDAYLEELIVRRELAMNFVYYTNKYSDYGCLPRWAEETLAQHRKDHREYIYSRSRLENADTHDDYWNAAMREMKLTGFMHSHMRMYWGKKILEWTKTPEQAFRTMLALNNKYFLDGRDPNAYNGVAWIFGVHDRAWFERPIFGKIRYMAASGLERKCDIQGYLKKIDALGKIA